MSAPDDLRAENARLKERSDVYLDKGEVQGRELARLRAHVAALVEQLELTDDYVTHAPGCAVRGRINPCSCGLEELSVKLRAILDAPDLAALVAREQARDAVVEVARRLDHAWATRAPTSEIARLDLDLTGALRTLDAAEKQS